ncbi:hypothetical protein POSPLADRAFT_1074898 [Postia placenta MAD-698-R-SB12]|uniref:Uncharacterized protein n=1 Tax=Postia placenta MAD-698-R-SB12 TaxID=670580 RepID=A0A1X6MY76_9APHY|nr:hypothetical protein POSPLADRAFT_1074898 [Postia placenta MAD-698-R-SB12]OSX61315.1 hypothetical protein POSPLADRAFT_1074898 [Postia placenta MAD-698-R-SB12]
MAPTYAPCPRPILKRPTTTPAVPAAAPRDESTELLAIDRGILQPVYDRSPIVVQPNRCALPERGCPGRTYTLGDDASASPTPGSSSSRTRSPTRAGRHLHPRAAPGFVARETDDDDDDDDPTPRATPTVTVPALPQLIPDMSSESEESDGFTSPPTESVAAGTYHRTGLAIPRAKDADALGMSFAAMQLGTSPSALSFLPHPPSPRVRPAASSPSSPGAVRHIAAPGHPPEDEPTRVHRHSSSVGSVAGSPPRRKHVRTRSGASPDAARARYKALSERSALIGCGLAVPDQGCLGGF